MGGGRPASAGWHSQAPRKCNLPLSRVLNLILLVTLASIYFGALDRPRWSLSDATASQFDPESENIKQYIATLERAVHFSGRNRSRFGILSSNRWSDCMLPARDDVVKNHREYARRHGYPYLTEEHTWYEQEAKGRKQIWGKIDAVEKWIGIVDYLLWIDIDALFMNMTIPLESFVQDHPNADLIIQQPLTDPWSFNAGVFLIRNSNWTRTYLQRVQQETKYYQKPTFEQQAMWEVGKEAEFFRRIYTSKSNSYIQAMCGFPTLPPGGNAPPKAVDTCHWREGDFIIHFAPPLCPRDQVISYAAISAKLNGYG